METIYFSSINPSINFDHLIKPINDRVGWMPIENFRFDPKSSKDYFVKANWALYCDNYLEGFHISCSWRSKSSS